MKEKLIFDPQATNVEPISIENFDLDEYFDYSENLNKKCKEFFENTSGILVYRRVRVAECFSHGCKDMKRSLELQLGALKYSMKFKADVPNFLEPWYGIGIVASAYGNDYIWYEGNAPAMKPIFNSVDEILNYEPKEISKTPIGKHVLNMIEYFLEKTKGKIPISFTDSQSPLNIVNNLIPLDKFFYELLINPEKVKKLLNTLSELSKSFNKEQFKLIGDSTVFPGHGFASSKCWKGLGVSDDNIVMISPEDYKNIAIPSLEKLGYDFGGIAFHSCGDWTNWINAVLSIKNLKMVDAALSKEIDPGATENIESFHAFANTGIIINARISGNLSTIENVLKRLWTKGMKLIVVTYCNTPAEQEKAYELIYEICN